MSSIIGVANAFGLLYDSIWSKDFRKSLDLHIKSERELLPLVRAFLLGYYGALDPESWSALPGCVSGWGRIDFVVGGTAVELALRRPGYNKGELLPSKNESEVKKLLKYPKKSMLILYGFAQEPITLNELKRYKKLPTLGKGPHRKSPFHVAYFHKKVRHRFRVDP